MSQVIIQICKLSHPALVTKVRAQSPSRLLTFKSEKTFSLETEKGWRFYGVTFSSCYWHNAVPRLVKFGAINSGEKWWIREVDHPSIYSS